jgi:hypothetical protein
VTYVPLERSRVAELIVTRADGRQRGSGYRTSTNSVLTAAHVVDGATSVQVRFEPDLDGEWTVEATSWWADPVSDLAVVAIDAPAPVAPARFARIEDRAAVLTVMAVGFPWWKVRTDVNGKKYRDSHQVVGTVAVLSNWREGTLEVVVDPATPRGDHSPWEGMSGAVLWADDRIVGVLAKHHPGDGLGRLAAARLDLALDRVDPQHGTPLRDALAVPAPLASVLAPHRAIATRTYQALAAEAAPQHLHDRSWELGELVRFCAGVVSFFITGRWVGQSDSDAFTEAVIEQLAALLGEPPEPALEARARAGHLLACSEPLPRTAGCCWSSTASTRTPAAASTCLASRACCRVSCHRTSACSSRAARTQDYRPTYRPTIRSRRSRRACSRFRRTPGIWSTRRSASCRCCCAGQACTATCSAWSQRPAAV